MLQYPNKLIVGIVVRKPLELLNPIIFLLAHKTVYLISPQSYALFPICVLFPLLKITNILFVSSFLFRPSTGTFVFHHPLFGEVDFFTAFTRIEIEGEGGAGVEIDVAGFPHHSYLHRGSPSVFPQPVRHAVSLWVDPVTKKWIMILLSTLVSTAKSTVSLVGGSGVLEWGS
jgi:hypothetical protein